MTNKKPFLSEAILDKWLTSSDGNDITPKVRSLTILAMKEYAKEMIKKQKEYDKIPRRRFLFMALGVFTKLSWEGFIIKLRVRNLNRHKKIAQELSNADRRKYYIIRDGSISYSRFSSADIDFNKRRNILSKSKTAKDIAEVADAVIYPKNIY